MSQLIQAAKAPEIKTVYCVGLEGGAVGGVNWFWEESKRTECPRNKSHVWFDIDVPASATQAEITELADQAALNSLYEDGRPDCRLTGPRQLFNVTLDWEPGDDEQGDYASAVWAVDEDDAIRRVAEEMAHSGEVSHDTDARRAAYIERVIDGAGQHAAERVQDTLVYDLKNFLRDRPDAFKAIQAILDGEPTADTQCSLAEGDAPDAPWSAETGPMTEGQYRAFKGVCCPSCGGSDLSGSQLEVDAGTCSQPRPALSARRTGLTPMSLPVTPTLRVVSILRPWKRRWRMSKSEARSTDFVWMARLKRASASASRATPSAST